MAQRRPEVKRPEVMSRNGRVPVGRLEALLEQLADADRRLGGSGMPAVVTGLSRQNSVYRHVLDVCDRLADAALRGLGAAELSELLATLLGRTVVVLDPKFALQLCAGAEHALPMWSVDDPAARGLRRALAVGRRPLRLPAMPGSAFPHGCLAVPITVGSTDLGYLLIAGGSVQSESDDSDLLVSSYVATLFALALAGERTSLELGMRHRAAIVESLVSGHFIDADDAQHKARALGLADVVTRVGVVAWGTEAMSEPVLERVEAVRATLTAAVAAIATRMRGTELVMIIEESEGLDALVESLESVLSAEPGAPLLTCGLSDPAERAELLPRALRQAEHAVQIGTRIGRAGAVVRYRELGIYRLLLQIGDLGELWRFADEVLGPLIHYDATHKLDLVRTLSVFLNQRESLKQTARRLQVHVNTVSYRLNRIAQLTPLDLANPDDRLLAHIAVKILEAQSGDVRGSNPG